jgi:hypothetical protein
MEPSMDFSLLVFKTFQRAIFSVPFYKSSAFKAIDFSVIVIACQEE